MRTTLLEIFGIAMVVGIVINGHQGMLSYLDRAAPTPRAMYLFAWLAIILSPLWLPLPIYPDATHSVFGSFSELGWISVLGVASMIGIVQSPMR